MGEVDTAIRYIFVISVILVLVAYWAGTTKVAETFGGQLNSLLMTATGRNANGQFAGYPSGGPTA